MYIYIYICTGLCIYIPSFFKCVECRASVAASHNDQEQQVIWTDGASGLNQDNRFRRAGLGIYYGDGHCMNMSVILPGLVQTNQRAELPAVVLACLRLRCFGLGLPC